MRKLVWFMHVSLDGFVAGPKGEMDWIRVDEEIFDYAGSNTDQADTALYGRVTWQMMDGYWPTAGSKPGASKHDVQHSRWYNKVEKVVLSKTMAGTERPGTKFVGRDVAGEIAALKRSAGRDILMFGSPGAAHALMAENLIDDYWLFINPVILGQGIPLFKGIKERTPLTLVASKVFSSGVACLHYNYRGDKS